MNNKNLFLFVLLFSSLTAYATIFGTVSGLIHDPQHRPVQGAQITLRATDSAWTQSATSDQSGEFRFDIVPLGEYSVTVELQGFAPEQQKLVLGSGREARMHFSLTVAQAKETVEVKDTSQLVNTESSSTTSLVSRRQIAETPGADQTNSLSMITDYVPGAYMVHDQLHIRGGHQVSWLIDGVPVPNTNIASNVGPQFDPKDIDYLEVQRGGYSAEYGDRTYGVFNVVTRSGFERDRQAELVTSYGSFNRTEDQFSFGDHTERFAYYGSISGNRTDLGLETPSPDVQHDLGAGLSGFTSMTFNKTANDQLRLVASARGDHYQVPNDPDQQAAGIRDVENERDDLVNFSWLHTLDPGTILTVSPFYHFNRAHYIGGYTGEPDPNVVIPEDDRGSNYFGGVASLAVNRGKHNARAGLQVFGARDNQLFGIVTSDGSNPPLNQREMVWGNVEALFLEDQFKLTSWLTLNGGVRLTHFGSTISENAVDPRIGAAIRIPRLNWVLRGFYGRYYQAPPLLTVNGPLLEQAAQQGFGFLPLRGERDEQHEFGLTIPFAGWTFDVSNFRTGARNFFDHDVLGNSNIFFPLTIDRARIRGWEATANSPRIARLAQFHASYSHQYAEGAGGVTGGLTDFEPPDEGYFFLDHDQRNTLSTGFNMQLPWRIWTDFNANYGSGFVDGEGPEHLPSHTTFDLSVGKSFGENWNVRVSGLNLSNHRYLLDNSNTFGGTHYVNPREISLQVKYRFRY
ncbi:MAG TPA: TonB-dependent receptor [Terriglobales bacterium]|nr:TonB-dependent receptor [Terriglobales bacterium]